MADIDTRDGNAVRSGSNTVAALARIYWMMIGYATPVFVALAIATSAHAFGSRDLVFWLAVGSLVVVRYLDVTRFHGTTADGEPATIAHWRRYTMFVAGAAIASWSLAHVIAHFLTA